MDLLSRLFGNGRKRAGLVTGRLEGAAGMFLGIIKGFISGTEQAWSRIRMPGEEGDATGYPDVGDQPIGKADIQAAQLVQEFLGYVGGLRQVRIRKDESHLIPTVTGQEVG